ncbi:HdaA/DnaA family protein [Rhodospirillum rubrum]|uniref:Regulatory inactivation of DnaA Hda protein n=1 Tax=Rhodospirillum rubrum (strain ATCC 11170 / ATH 1.1.1 / DSM 467 / LMG 4362 / NCIMB 8255 / S1) TaxID=269796 RepID=Q2RSD2_RHORT|nr:regulatory inactivation of DnaA Hda protein [Rhodospirillum rubrum]ABC22963.1 regulatory inactivation of DnaA Hda protein [Rhodospirillum rubrum ATCC 11170]AEO48693.1 regulatory inactivation of DnaA Hda protein [Rhodospirillum rubrum F11]MBK5954588.1 DnaA regulatory inactivator Hda [Rhodospirillum rubrum]QXG78949.1 DnaA regulatory inactivator Hda [Rhodospirillum rubrum]HAP98847.1 DnaA regulatory inactivator Hda [Rhodospirillum rubrum]
MSAGVQLPLDLPWRPALGREHFLVAACNASAVALVEAWPHWPAPAACIHGPTGAGKTHLAQVFATRAAAVVLDPAVILGTDPLTLFEGGRAAVIEDADRAGLPEATLFHLLNAARQRGGSLLLTALSPPARWGVHLADLRSRLAALPAEGLCEPDDELMAAVLLKLFSDRGLDVAPGAIGYLLPRMERSFAAARDLVVHADALALREGRAVTVPLLRQLLATPDRADR